jgi:hypothetical protein
MTTVRTKVLNKIPNGSGEDFANNLKLNHKSAMYGDNDCDLMNPAFPLVDYDCISTSNGYMGYEIDFNIKDEIGGYYEFSLGADFGLGAALWIDGKFVEAFNYPMNW